MRISARAKVLSVTFAIVSFVSIFLPVASAGRVTSELFDGIFVLTNGFFHISWYANPMIVPLTYVIVRNGSSSGVSLISLGMFLALLAIPALWWDNIPRGAGGDRFIVAYHSGYYLWLLAVFGLSAASLMTGLRLKFHDRVEHE